MADNAIMALRFSSAIGICLALVASVMYAQAPAAGPTFDVASIKPSPPVTPAMVAGGTIHAGMKIDAARVDIGMSSLMQLICRAYDVKPYQVSGPQWLNAQRFDIVAKMPDGATKEQVPQMLQALLADRFKLTLHREATKEMPVYALVVAKGGPKMKESDPDPAAPPAAANPGDPAPPASSGSSQVTVKTSGNGAVASDGEGRSQKMSMSADGKSMHIEASKITMAQLAEGLFPLVGKPVVDMTELKGNYQIVLDLSLQDLLNAARAQGANVPNLPGAGGDANKPAEAASDPSSGSIFNAVQGLGLKLEPRKIALDRLIIDAVEKTPTEN